ncbi:MAG: hypothetical protein R3B95_10200 [Nitrospirales bacterium]|nr:hypothetical protein [Nitrospirales bacterium]
MLMFTRGYSFVGQKSVSDLELVLSKNIGEIHAESFVEIERIGDISKKLGVTANAIRVNP